jgi:flagellar hook protein FlgE
MSFQQGLSGLNAASRNLDAIGNNVANANTVGAKSARAEFADVFANAAGGAASVQTGIGVAVSGVTQQFSQGAISTTSNPLDVAINGSGFFRLSTNGVLSYSRNGQFKLDKEGFMVNTQGARVTGFPVDSAGRVSTGSPTDIRLNTADIEPRRSAEVEGELNFDARAAIITAPFDPADSATYNNATSVTVYDSLGQNHTMSLYFQKTANNSWDVFAAEDGVQIGGAAVGSIDFDATTGLVTSGGTFNVSMPVTTGAASPLAMSINFDGATQFGSSFGVTSITQDGFGPGRLSGYSLSADGTIMGRYSNGQTRAQGQLALVNFAAPQSLSSLGGNAWGETSGSGPALIGSPGTGSLGVVQSGAVEESNVDLTAELVNMITAQRVYQANAQTIKTQDQVLQTLVNLR